METVVVNAVVWFALTPIIVIGILSGFLVIGHYTPVLRTIDAFFFSLLAAMLLDILILILIQGVIFIQNVNWTEDLCRFYTWASVTFRFAELFTIAVFSIDRVLLIKLHGVAYTYYADKLTAALIVAVWMAASFVGAVIVAGWEDVVFFARGECTYLAHELHPRFAIFVCVMEVCCAVICVFCLADAWCHLKYFNSRPSMSMSSIQGESDPRWKTPDVAAAYDNCTTGFTVVVILLFINHVPYAVLSLVGMLTVKSASGGLVSSLALRLVSLWLLVVQAMVIPHCLWLVNRRYRKALKHLKDWYTCTAHFYSQESRQQVPKLHMYTKHQPPTSVQQGTANHEPLRCLAANARQSSFHYESFQPPPTKSSSESNLAVLANQKSANYTRSRSLEADLGQSSTRGRYEPTVGARNLQMDDIIVHGRWDLSDIGDTLASKTSSQRSGDSSTSSIQSPKPKRRRMMSEPTPTATPLAMRQSEATAAHMSSSSSDGHVQSTSNSDHPQQNSKVSKKNKVFTKKSPRNSLNDMDTSSESSVESGKLIYNDDDIDAGLNQAQGSDISPEDFEPIPCDPTAMTQRKASNTWDEIYKFDNYVEEIIVPKRDFVVVEQDSETIDEFSSSEFDETSVDDQSMNGPENWSMEDLYPMNFKHSQVPQWTDDGTITVIRKPLTDSAASNVPQESSGSKEEPSKPPFRRLSSFGKPLPASSEPFEELDFSTDNPLYETLSRKERFEQSKHEFQRALSMNERDREEQRNVVSKEDSGSQSKSDLQENDNRTNVIREISNDIESVEKEGTGEIIYIPLQTGTSNMIKQQSAQNRRSVAESSNNDVTDSGKANSITKQKPKLVPKPKLTQPDKLFKTQNGNVSTHIDPETQKRDLLSDINNTLPKTRDAISSRRPQDMEGYIYSRGRGKVIGHYGTASTAV